MCSWLQIIWLWNRAHTYLRCMSHLIYLVHGKKIIITSQTKYVMTSGPFTGSYHLMCENHLTISGSWTSTCWTLKCSCFFPHLLQPKYVLYPKYLHQHQRGVGIFFIKVVSFLLMHHVLSFPRCGSSSTSFWGHPAAGACNTDRGYHMCLLYDLWLDNSLSLCGNKHLFQCTESKFWIFYKRAGVYSSIKIMW